MEKSIELISEDEKSYTAIIDGKTTKLFKINIDEINSNHREDLLKASKFISEDILEDILFFTRRIIQFVPLITEYERVANKTTELMNKVYNILKPHNLSHLMHHLVKNTDPKIYGKAGTFMRQIELFNEDLEEMMKFLNNS